MWRLPRKQLMAWKVPAVSPPADRASSSSVPFPPEKPVGGTQRKYSPFGLLASSVS